MMDSIIFLRLCSLFRKLGIDVYGNKLEMAELRGYSAALELIDENMYQNYHDAFVQTADKRGFGMFLNLIDETMQNTHYETIEAIIASITGRNKLLSKSDFDLAVKEFDESSFYEIVDNIFVLSIRAVKDKKYLKRLKHFIENYAPAYLLMRLNGNGLSFASWEALKMKWCDFNSNNLAFSVLDTLKQ